MQFVIEVATTHLACDTDALFCSLRIQAFFKQFSSGIQPEPGIVFAGPCCRSCYFFSVEMIQLTFAGSNQSHAVLLVDAAAIPLIAAMQRTACLIVSYIISS